MHIPVLLDAAIDALSIRADGIYVDGTFGQGGHSRLILSKLGEHGRLIVFDKDPAAIDLARSMKDERLHVVHGSYVKLDETLRALAIKGVDGVLLDLGVSSMQLEEATRGFSFLRDGPLDMRMDTSCGETAAQWLATVDEATLSGVIRDYGEERYAKQIAGAIVMERSRRPITTTLQLAETVAAVVRARSHGRVYRQHPATRTFQAIRIYLNQELEALSLTLPMCLSRLNPAGRLVVISFHSLEDRIVKNFMRAQAMTDDLPRRLPVREDERMQYCRQQLLMVGKKIRPGTDEIAANPRARSAIMRVAEKLGSA